MTLLLLLRNHGASAPVVTPPVTAFSWSDAGQTPDEFEQRLRFDVVLCKRTGEPVGEITDWKSIQLDRQLNLPVSVTLEFNMDNPLYQWVSPLQRPRILVYRPPTAEEIALDPTTVRTLIFHGEAPEYAFDEDAASGFAKVSFQDQRWRFNDAFVPIQLGTYTAGASWGFVAISAISNTIGANRLGAASEFPATIGEDGINTGTPMGTTYQIEPGKNLATLIDEITKADGGIDIDYTPGNFWPTASSRYMGFVYIMASQGSDKPNAHFIYTDTGAGGIAGNCGNMRRTFTKVITSATTTGTDNSTGLATAQTYSVSSTSVFGLREEYTSTTDATIASQMLSRSVGRVNSRQTPIGVIDVVDPTREAPQPFIDYDIGDTIYATCRRPGMEFYNEPLRVHGFSVTMDANGDMKSRITIANTND